MDYQEISIRSAQINIPFSFGRREYRWFFSQEDYNFIQSMEIDLCNKLKQYHPLVSFQNNIWNNANTNSNIFAAYFEDDDNGLINSGEWYGEVPGPTILDILRHYGLRFEVLEDGFNGNNLWYRLRILNYYDPEGVIERKDQFIIETNIQIDKLNRCNDSLSKQNHKLLRQNDELNTKCAHMNKSVMDKENSIDRLTSDINKLTKDSNNKQTKIIEITNEIKELHKQINTNSKINEDAKKNLEKINMQESLIETLQNNTHEQYNSYQKKCSIIDTINVELNISKTAIDNLNTKMRMSEMDSYKKDEMIKQIYIKNSDLINECSSLRLEHSSLISKSEKLQNDVEQLTNEHNKKICAKNIVIDDIHKKYVSEIQNIIELKHIIGIKDKQLEDSMSKNNTEINYLNDMLNEMRCVIKINMDKYNDIIAKLTSENTTLIFENTNLKIDIDEIQKELDKSEDRKEEFELVKSVIADMKKESDALLAESIIIPSEIQENTDKKNVLIDNIVPYTTDDVIISETVDDIIQKVIEEDIDEWMVVDNYIK